MHRMLTKVSVDDMENVVQSIRQSFSCSLNVRIALKRWPRRAHLRQARLATGSTSQPLFLNGMNFISQ